MNMIAWLSVSAQKSQARLNVVCSIYIHHIGCCCAYLLCMWNKVRKFVQPLCIKNHGGTSQSTLAEKLGAGGVVQNN